MWLIEGGMMIIWFCLWNMSAGRIGKVYWSKKESYRYRKVLLKVELSPCRHGMDRERGLLFAPSDYHHRSTESIKIYIERYTHTISDPDNHLILLAGGPGQRSAVWKSDLPHLIPDTTIYLLEQRGVGHSSRLLDANDRSWRRSSWRPSHHPRRYSVSNAARDVELFARTLKGRVSLLGVSYGGLLAARVVTLFPDRFSWLILDSPSMIRDRFRSDNDRMFWRVCQEDHFCKGQIGSVKAIRRAFHRIIEGKRKNPCCRLIRKDLPSLLRPLQRATLQDTDDGEHHPSMLIIPFILSAYKCQDYQLFRRTILQKLRRLIKRGSIPAEGKNTNTSISPNHETLEGKNTYSLHDFHNSYICTTEIFSYPRRPAECRSKARNMITDQCSNWKHYQKAARILSKYAYDLDNFRDNPIKTDRTRVVLVSGMLDLITPPPAAVRWLKSIKSRRKLALLYKTHGHALVPTAPCLQYLFKAISGDQEKTSLRTLLHCIRLNNNTGPNWNFSGDYSFAKYWWDI